MKQLVSIWSNTVQSKELRFHSCLQGNSQVKRNAPVNLIEPKSPDDTNDDSEIHFWY